MLILLVARIAPTAVLLALFSAAASEEVALVVVALITEASVAVTDASPLEAVSVESVASAVTLAVELGSLPVCKYVGSLLPSSALNALNRTLLAG